jgi:DNA polymerase III gamma/tau subunit
MAGSTVKALKKTVEKSIPNGMLFVGFTGCGKTTSARVLKNTFNISNFDWRELNCSSQNGVEMARDLEKAYTSPPFSSKYRFYILDECHQLTTAAWQVLLKPVEDAPETTKFIFITSEPNKIPKAMLTRLSRFDFAPLTEVELVRWYVKNSDVDVDTEDLRKCAAASSGSAREFIKIVDGFIKTGEILPAMSSQDDAGGNIAYAIVKRKNWSTIAELIKGVTDYESTRIGILNYCSAMLLNGADGGYDIAKYFTKPTYEKGSFVLAVYSCVKGKSLN